MSRLQEVMNEMETNESQNIEESSTKETSSASEHPAADVVENEGVNEGTDVQNQAASEPSAKKPFTKEEQMTHSFKRQLNRQRKKYESQISSFTERIQALENKLQENLGAMDETEKKTLEIEKLVAERMKAQMQESQALQESQAQHIAATQEKIRKNFSNEAEITAFQTMVKQAMEHPLIGELFSSEEAANLMNIVNESEISPRMLQYFIAKPEEFERILDLDDATEQKVEVKLLERGLANYLKSLQTNQTTHQQTTTSNTNVPVTGEIGRTSTSVNAEEDPIEQYRRLTGRG